jgi:hypothetical protein
MRFIASVFGDKKWRTPPVFVPHLTKAMNYQVEYDHICPDRHGSRERDFNPIIGLGHQFIGVLANDVHGILW